MALLPVVAGVDVVDETFLAVPPAVVAAVFADPAAWPGFWPDLLPAVYADRGVEGMRWTVTGALVGSMEVWLEPMSDGTLLHYFLRAELPGTPTPRRVRAEIRRRQLAAKAVAFGLKASLEAGRPAGVAPPLP
ncbi:hypothetical protein GCM10022243_47370 [Saccharothrix violaceirubra]|uniref:Polyketide cyclase/dehydrase/lipid transport protein n=1 Tax=Saccharothrix violaceirubra TaxID=413306 RepID=A0A7W7T832_9PSEU|nr:polyketide cyclase / dehydrase and lipid transport [Saccharothrix violaceirubra]MBB4967722.1 hypothetical protein [Saccharothrix violaceirubra]